MARYRQILSAKSALGVLLVVLAASLMGACGGSGSEADSATASNAPEPLTKQEYIAAADKVCLQVRKKVDPISAQVEKRAASLASVPNEEVQTKRILSLVRLLRKFDSAYSGGTDELKALAAPEGGATPSEYLALRDDYSAYAVTAAATYKDFTEAKTAAGKEKVNKRITAALDDEARIGKKLRRSAKAYGFKVCGRPKK